MISEYDLVSFFVNLLFLQKLAPGQLTRQEKSPDQNYVPVSLD